MRALARVRGMVGWLAALLCFALLGLIPSTASAAIALVQQKNGTSASATSLPVPFTTAPTTTAGNVLIMVGGTSTGSLSGVSGGGVGNWFKAQSSTTNTHIEIWYGAVDIATNTSTTPVTITAATAGGMWMTLTEWSGVSLTIDKSAAQAGTSSPASAPSITTTNASDLVILGIADNIGNTFGSPTPGSWTALTAVTTPEAQTTWYQIAAVTGTFNPTVTETANTWDAAIAAFQGCAATTSDASYLTGNAQNGAVKIYWASPNQVLIVRNTSNLFGTPSGAYKVGDAAPGSVGTIVHSGSGSVAPGTFNESIANGTYYYKVWTNCDLTYSAGVVLTVAPATTSRWSYVTTAATLAPPGIDDNNVVIWGGNDNKVHGADANTGALEFPVFTQPTGAIQARPPIIPAAYSQTGVNVAYVTSQDGNVYAINTATGAQLWKKSLIASPKLQGGAAVWLQALQPLSICGAMTDVVFVGTRDTATTTGNIVYALNAGTSAVTTSSALGGTCVNATVNPGDVLWTFTGNATFKLDVIVSTPYVDYTTYAGNTYALWVTSNAASGLLQPSLWKFNVQNGTLFNGNATNCTTPATSCWSLGHTDSSPSASGDGNWIYVGTNCIPAGCATQAATLNAVEISTGTVKTHAPGTGGFNGTGNIRGPYPLRWTSFGATSTIARVNNNIKVQNTSQATCQVSLSMTAGNTVILVITAPSNFFSQPSPIVKITGVSDTSSNLYTKRFTQGVTAGPVGVEIWSTTVSTTGTVPVTVTFSANTVSTCSLAQYSGVGAVGAPANNFNTGSTNPTVTTTAATFDNSNWVVAAHATAGTALATSLTGTLLQTNTITGLAMALTDNSSGSKAAVTNAITYAKKAWGSAAVELRSVASDQIIYSRDQTTHAVQFTGSTGQFNQVWVLSPGVNMGTPVDDGAGRLWVGAGNGTVWQLDAWSGSNGIWYKNLVPGGSTVQLGDVSFDGITSRIYIGGSDGKVYGINVPF